MTSRLSLLRQMASSSDPALRDQGERELRWREEARQKAKALRRSKRGRAPGKSKAQRRTERDARWVEIKTAVRARVEAERQGRCEWGCERPADDPHHLLGGGARQAYEAPETVAGICREDHRGYEKADPDVLRRAKAWAIDHRFGVALREIEHRAWKATEARAEARKATR